jgi:hypothetical protein
LPFVARAGPRPVSNAMPGWTVACVVGLLAGLHTATWGMYKDSPHEGFTTRRFLRSPAIGALAGPVVMWLGRIDPHTAGGLVVLFGATYGAERVLVEYWKTFVREEDQSKYTIPMQFAVRGIVTSRRARCAAGLAYGCGELMLAAGVVWIDRVAPAWPPVVLALAVGSVAGWVSAFGGAWKDAPIEGFHTLKFFRSPLLAGAYGIMVGSFTPYLLVILLGALGYTIATTETYKTFGFPSTPRGKFAGKGITHPEAVRFRRRFVPLYAAVWLAVIVTIVIAYREAHGGA